MTPEEYIQEVGKRLEAHRIQQKISRKQLSKMTCPDIEGAEGISEKTIYNIEVGNGGDFLTIALMRHALKMTAEDLEHDLVMGTLHDIHPGGSAESQKKSADEQSVDQQELG